MPPKFGGGGRAKCGKCGKTAYEAESVAVNGVRIHRACFRCTKCNMLMRLNAFRALDGVLYCEPHAEQIITGEAEPVADAPKL